MSAPTRVKTVCFGLVTATTLAAVLFWTGCGRGGSDATHQENTNRNTNGNTNTANVNANASADQPFTIGETQFQSQQEFVDKIRPRCATTEPPRARRIAINNRIAAMRAAAPQERAPASVEIPVFFHVLTNAAGTQGNISDADVQRQIDVLNEAFAGRGPGGTGTPTPFRFTLVAIDRTANDAWFNMSFNDEQPTAEERAAKAALNRGGRSALNLYTANPGDDTLGWARWPWDFDAGVDGVVILYTTLPGGPIDHYNLGDTAVHEVGHWLALFHTFQGGCEDPGDEVDDTAAERSPAAGCPPARDTCPIQSGGDPVENYMDYSVDSCMFRFTPGQTSRMDAAHLRYRR